MNARQVVLFVSIIFSLPITPYVSAEPAEVRGVFYLKVRGAPDFDAEETGVLAAGDVVDVIGEVGRWANVVLEDGSTGYVSRKYLSPVTTPERSGEQPQSSEHAATAPSRGQAEEPATEQEPEKAPQEQTTEAPETVDPAESIRTGDAEGPVQDPPPPTEKPQLIIPRARRERGPSPCTAADIERLRREIGNLAATQSRLAALIAADTGEKPASRDWISSISTRQMLFWLGAGCVIGWLAAVGLRHRRERRQRGRIRI